MSPGEACRKAGAYLLFSAVPIVRGIVSTTTFPTPQHVSVDGAGESTVTRIQSIDIFRGITLAVMILVNDLDGTKGLPWWTFHANASWDVMTYVDMVIIGRVQGSPRRPPFTCTPSLRRPANPNTS